MHFYLLVVCHSVIGLFFSEQGFFLPNCTGNFCRFFPVLFPKLENLRTMPHKFWTFDQETSLFSFLHVNKFWLNWVPTHHHTFSSVRENITTSYLSSHFYAKSKTQHLEKEKGSLFIERATSNKVVKTRKRRRSH